MPVLIKIIIMLPCSFSNFVCIVLWQCVFFHVFRVEAIGQIEDLLSDLKVIEFDSNCIRLAMKTSFPTFECLSYLHKLDFANEPSVLDHELLIELVDGTMQLKNVEVFF